jgi:hypothetical protein
MAVAPLLGAGGSAIGLSAAGAYENVTLPAVKGECPTSRMVACGIRRNASYFRGLIEVLTQLSPLTNATLSLTTGSHMALERCLLLMCLPVT